MEKLYCYVDESGLDTMGEAFFVAVVITAGEQQVARDRLEQIEREVKKIRPKWNRTFPAVRAAYIQRVLQEKGLFERLLFRRYFGGGTQDYLERTAETTAEALLEYVTAEDVVRSQVTILVDGLPEASVEVFRKFLRPRLHASRRRVDTRKIRGLRDDNDALMRLADALVGFVRSAWMEPNGELAALFKKAMKDGLVTEV
jgi:hypothetical protein